MLGSNGSAMPSTVFSAGTSRYLEVVVEGTTLGPRQQIGSVAYAGRSESAGQSDTASDLSCSDCVDFSGGGSEVISVPADGDFSGWCVPSVNGMRFLKCDGHRTNGQWWHIMCVVE